MASLPRLLHWLLETTKPSGKLPEQRRRQARKCSRVMGICFAYVPTAIPSLSAFVPKSFQDVMVMPLSAKRSHSNGVLFKICTTAVKAVSSPRGSASESRLSPRNRLYVADGSDNGLCSSRAIHRVAALASEGRLAMRISSPERICTVTSLVAAITESNDKERGNQYFEMLHPRAQIRAVIPEMTKGIHKRCIARTRVPDEPHATALSARCA